MLLLLLLVEPLALVALYFAEVGLPNRSDEHSPPYIRLESLTSSMMHRTEDALPPTVPTDLNAAEHERTDGASSHITAVRGKYVIELRGAEIARALDMLSKATHTTVTGADVLAGVPDRLNRSLIASSKAEAWQAVFGDVANYALGCTSNRCAVHFVATGAHHEPTAPGEPPLASQAASVSMPYALAEPTSDSLVSDPDRPRPQRNRRSRD